MASSLNATTSSGVVVTSDNTGNLALQSAGTTVATATSTGFQISTYTPGTSLITSGTAQASTSGTSITFSSIPSWVKRITMMYNGVGTSGTSNKIIQLGSGSATTTGYLGTGSYISGSAAGAAAYTTGFGINSGGAVDRIYGSIIFTLLNSSSNLWTAQGTFASSGTITWFVSGSITLAGALDRVIATTVNGTDTYAAGSINILYE